MVRSLAILAIALSALLPAQAAAQDPMQDEPPEIAVQDSGPPAVLDEPAANASGSGEEADEPGGGASPAPTGALPNAAALPDRPTESPATPTPPKEPLPRRLGESPDLVQFDIGPGVPAQDVAAIRRGFQLAQAVLEQKYGGDIRMTRPLVVKLVATGRGNEELGGEGACCTATDPTGARPFFDVRNRDWVDQPDIAGRAQAGHWSSAGHEYAHGWQWSLGCLSQTSQPLGGWMNEGIATYVATDALIEAGILTRDFYRFGALGGARGGEDAVALQSLEQSRGLWPGHIGFLAVENLVARSPYGPRSLRVVCQQVADGAGIDDAFLSAFGVTRTDFYRQFPGYLDGLKNGPIKLLFDGQLPSGAVSWAANPAWTPYRFLYVGPGMEQLIDPIRAKIEYPAYICRSGGNLPMLYAVLCADAPAGTYTLTVTLTDGRKAQVAFQHVPGRHRDGGDGPLIRVTARTALSESIFLGLDLL